MRGLVIRTDGKINLLIKKLLDLSY